MKFYQFSQNNSGGSFHINDTVAHHVVIEAASAADANAKAQDIGIYFNGCDDDRDCPCCGDRWYPTDEYDAEDKPEIYGMEPAKYEDWFTPKGKPKCIIHYADGRKELVLQEDAR
jgi:hypothetical protein